METVIEVKSNVFLNDDNSYFEMVLGEPINIKSGSSINYIDGLIDLGATSTTNITVENDMLLGFQYFVYEQDIPKIPDNFSAGTIDKYNKRYIYRAPDQDKVDPKTFIIENTNNPPQKSYGYKTVEYRPSCLSAFLFEKTGRRKLINNPPYNQNNPPISEDILNAVERTAQILIKAGTYSKTKFTQLVNDGFNLVTGGLNNNDKPYEINVGGDDEPLDFTVNPNNTSQLLEPINYKYDQSSFIAADNLGLIGDASLSPMFSRDVDNFFYFIPVYSEDNPNFIINEPFYPYIWFEDDSEGWLTGTTKFNLEYDSDSNLFFLDYLHSPYIDKDGKESVLITPVDGIYRKSGAKDASSETVGYKVASRLSGIMLSRLFSIDVDSSGNPIDNVNTLFWQNKLGFTGFDDTYRQNITFTTLTNDLFSYSKDNDDIDIIYKFVYTYPDLKFFDIGTTKPLVPIQWLQQSNYTTNSNDYGMAIKSDELPKLFESIGTNPIIGDNIAFSESIPYYLIEVSINGLKNDNWRDRDSNYQIMNIAGRTYTTGDFLQTFDDGSLQSIVIYEDINIEKISIRILNPDKTLAQNLGQNSSFFIKITQPIVVDANQIKNKKD